MPSSGTYTFSMSRDDVINAALRLTGRFGSGDTIPPLEIANCAQALNIICKEMVTEGLPLWCVQDLAVPMIANQPTYNLSTLFGMNLPQRILDGYLRNAAGNDVQFAPKSRYDYDNLGLKSQVGIPNQCFYDPQIGAGTLTMYPVPITTSTHTYHVIIQRQIQDFNLATDNPDFPQEAFRLLKWCLADEVALEYQTPEPVRREINQKAAGLKSRFFDYQQEFVSVNFTPSERAR
jgi:hypothetical protein